MYVPATGATKAAVAVPVAAAIGVVARFLVSRYKSSRLYLGSAGPSED